MGNYIDDLILIANDREIGGWQSIRVTRGIERMPSDFMVKMTESWPGQAQGYYDVIQAGDPVSIKLGKDLVLTGYVDQFLPVISPGRHEITVTGRSKSQDLVDCSAEWPNGQIANSTAFALATKLAEPYGIEVILQGEDNYIVPQYNVSYGETPFSIIEFHCRYTALLAYDTPAGNLLLTRVGTKKAASGFTEGVNVQQAAAMYSMHDRFSDYAIMLLSLDTLRDVGDGGMLIHQIKDTNVPRHRMKYLVSDATLPDADAALSRIEWERARRYGRSMALHLKTDGWRDSDGVLYEPNTLVPLMLPGMKIIDQEWLIGEVTYIRDEHGTSCDLVIMPKEAFYTLQAFPPSFRDVIPSNVQSTKGNQS